MMWVNGLKKVAGGLAIYEEASLSELMEMTPSKINGGEARHLYSTNDSVPMQVRWFGAPFAELDELYKHGWAEGLKRVEKFKEKMLIKHGIPVARSRKRQRIKMDTGDELDLDRFRAGRFEDCWESMLRRVGRAKPIISISTRIGYNCDSHSDQFFWQGATAMILTDLLESAGYRVEMFAYSASTGTWIRMGRTDIPYIRVSRILLKDAREPLDKGRLTSLLCLAATFRKYEFMHMYNKEWQASGGLGQSISPEKYIEPHDLMLDDVTTEDKAAAAIKGLLDALNNGTDVCFGRER